MDIMSYSTNFEMSRNSDGAEIGRHTKQDGALGKSAEAKLHNRLFGPTSNYTRQVRPLLDSSKPIIVAVGISVNMIEELIERDQTMVMVATIKMRWRDEFLKWIPKDYEYVSFTAVPAEFIWLPDITVVNSPEATVLTHKTSHVQTDFTGEIGYFPSGRLMTRCNLHILYFPFDKQHCEILLESWIYPHQQLQIKPYISKDGKTVDIRETYTNHQWAITGYKVEMGATIYDGYNFSSIAFIFLLQRKSDYYFMYYVFPQLLLACLQTLSHTLPVEHPGRMTLLTSLFIGTSVTQAAVAVHIPKSSDSTSLLQIYMTTISCNLVLSLLVTFVMMYAVIRIPSMHPNKSPSVATMMLGFFSVLWPSSITPIGVAAVASFNNNNDNSTALAEEIASPKIDNVKDVSTRRDSSSGGVRHNRQCYDDDVTTTAASSSGIVFNKSAQSKTNRTNNLTTSQPQSHQENSYVPSEKKSSSAQFNPLQQRFPQLSSSSSMNDYNSVHRRLLEPASVVVRQNDPLCNNGKFSGEMSSDGNTFRLLSASRTETQLCHWNHSNHSNLNENADNPLLNKPVGTTSAYQSLPARSSLVLKSSLMSDYWQHMEGGGGGEIANRRKGKSPFNDTCEANIVKLDSNNNESSNGHLSNQHNQRKRRTSRATRGSQIMARSDQQQALRDLKRQWLLYCVALDKTIMYAQAVWHTIIPLFLFAVVPYYAPDPIPHVHVNHED